MVILFGCLTCLFALGIISGGGRGSVVGYVVSVVAMLFVCGYVG